MQLSEYIQIACVIVGLAGITLARVRFTRRQQANPGRNGVFRRGAQD